MLKKLSFLISIFIINFIYCQDIDYQKACVNIVTVNSKKDCFVAPSEGNKRCCYIEYNKDNKTCEFLEDTEHAINDKKGSQNIDIQCYSNFLLKYINYIIIFGSILFYLN